MKFWFFALAEFLPTTTDRTYTTSQPEETPGGTFMSERALTGWGTFATMEEGSWSGDQFFRAFSSNA